MSIVSYENYKIGCTSSSRKEVGVEQTWNWPLKLYSLQQIICPEDWSGNHRMECYPLLARL